MAGDISQEKYIKRVFWKGVYALIDEHIERRQSEDRCLVQVHILTNVINTLIDSGAVHISDIEGIAIWRDKPENMGFMGYHLPGRVDKSDEIS